MGAVLSQVQKGTGRVICYWSRQFTKPESGYFTTEKEALAAVSAVKEFYPYLYGFSFKLITNHNPLTSLRGVKDVGGRLTRSRWMLSLQQFNFQFEYKPGSTHSNADTLSRISSTLPAVAVIHEWTGNMDLLREEPQRKYMHITIDMKSRTLSCNNKLQDYTESGFVFIVLFQFEFRISTYTVIHSLLGELIIRVLWCEITC